MHKPPIRIIVPVLGIIFLLSMGAWYLVDAQAERENGQLQASGTVEAVEIAASPEFAGRVVEVLVAEGDSVEAGDLLYRLDSTLLESQRDRAEAAVASARSGVVTAEAGLELSQAGLASAQAAAQSAQVAIEAAQVQYDLALHSARAANAPTRTGAWREQRPSEFSQPVWYFDQQEQISAAENEVADALQALEAERGNLADVLDSATSADLEKAEERLREAQAAFLVAKDVRDRAQSGSDQEIRDYAQIVLDAAQDELDAAQADYEKILSTDAAQAVLEARSRLAVVDEIYETALDHLNLLRTGEESLQVRAAGVGVQQAEAAAAQAETNIAQAEVGVTQAAARLEQARQAVMQAEAELALLDVQISRLSVYAAVSGVVLNRSIEPGEFVQPGAAAITLAQVNDLTITVFLPEDRYGEVKLGERADVTVDSFPGEQFTAAVVRIADQAEFTPRNVQTQEGRRTTVFAVELSVSDADGKLKPGMPADVNFTR